MRSYGSKTTADAVAQVALCACLIVVGLRATVGQAAVGQAADGQGAVGQGAVAVPLLYLAVVTGKLCRVDLAEFRLPNALVVPGLGFAVAGVAWAAFAGGDSTGAGTAVGALAGATGYSGVLLVPALVGEAGMGDVKLAAVLGLVLGALGPGQAVLGPVMAFVAAGVVALVARVLGGTRADDRLAFGPFMLGGFWVAVALSPAV